MQSTQLNADHPNPPPFIHTSTLSHLAIIPPPRENQCRISVHVVIPTTTKKKKKKLHVYVIMQKRRKKNNFLNLEHSSTPKPPILPYAFQTKPILQRGKKTMERSLLLHLVVLDGWLALVLFAHSIPCPRTTAGCFCYCWSRRRAGHGWWRGNCGLLGSCRGACAYCCDIIIASPESAWGGA